MIRVGSGAASWARILEQGLALDELVEMKTSIEGEAQGESGGHQSPPTAGAAWRGAVPHHRRNSPMVEAWLHTGRVIFLGKLGGSRTAWSCALRDSRSGYWEGVARRGRVHSVTAAADGGSRTAWPCALRDSSSRINSSSCSCSTGSRRKQMRRRRSEG